jgi:hypothetical protein
LITYDIKRKWLIFSINGRADTMKSLVMRQRTIFRTHKCRYNLQCLSKEGRSAILKYIKESLQDLFIASAPPFLITFCNRGINSMEEGK